MPVVPVGGGSEVIKWGMVMIKMLEKVHLRLGGG